MSVADLRKLKGLSGPQGPMEPTPFLICWSLPSFFNL